MHVRVFVLLLGVHFAPTLASGEADRKTTIWGDHSHVDTCQMAQVSVLPKGNDNFGVSSRPVFLWLKGFYNLA